MRIERLGIERYGIFSDCRMGPFGSGLNLVSGPNEAGKTTFLSMILDILFGYPSGRSSRNDYKLIAGDRLSARLDVALESGERMVIGRRTGRGGGELELRDRDGGPLEGARLDRLVGHLSKEVYQNLYAFSLYELSSLETLNSDQIQARIYSAGTGLGNVSLPEVIGALEKQAGEIYKKQGSKQPMHELRKELRDLDQQLRELDAQTGRYDELVRERRELEQALERLRDEEAKLTRRLEREQSFARVWDDWESYQRTGYELKELPEVPEGFPRRAGEELVALEDDIRQQEKEVSGLTSEVERASAELESERDTGMEELLPHLDAIEKLRDGFEKFRDAVRDYPLREKEMEQQQDNLQRQVRELSPEWNPEDLENFDASIQSTQRMDTLSAAFRERQEALKDAEAALRQQETGPQMQGWADMAPQAASVLIFAGLGVWQLLGGNQEWGAILLVAGVLLAGMQWLTHGRKKAGIKRQQDERRVDYEQAREQYEASRKEYEDSLFELGLDRGLQPETVSRIFARVEAARLTLDELSGKQQRLKDIGGYIDEYTEKVRELFDRLDRKIPSGEDLVFAITGIIEDGKKAGSYSERTGKIRDRLDFYEDQLEKARKELDTILGQKKNLLERAGPGADEDDFIRTARAADRRQELDEERSRARARLLTECCGENGFEQYTADLEERSRDSVEEAIAYLGQEKQEIRERTGELDQRLGKVAKELEILNTETRGSELRFRRAAIVEEMNILAAEWAELTLASHVIRMATERYEKERQPEVIRHASGLLGKLTGGRYERISAPATRRTLEVMRPDGTVLEPEKLSRGTAEQLYLALRFGLLREMSEHHEPLPVVMDDILVNFDPERSEAACEAILELSRSHQVFYLTCHPAVVEMFGGRGKKTGLPEKNKEFTG